MCCSIVVLPRQGSKMVAGWGKRCCSVFCIMRRVAMHGKGWQAALQPELRVAEEQEALRL